MAIAALTYSSAVATAEAAPPDLTHPSFVRQWDPGSPSADSSTGARSITVDPFGNVYVLRVLSGTGAGSFRVQKYAHDGTPIASGFDNPLTGFVNDGFATDPQGHVFVTVPGGSAGAVVREFTSGGGELAQLNVPRLVGTTIAFDTSGHMYGNGRDAAGNPALNEYMLSGGSVALLNSTPYPGSPNTGFFPYNFFSVATDAAGYVYASGVSSAGPFLNKYGSGLSGPIGQLEACSVAGSCFGGFSLSFGYSLLLSSGTTPTIFSGGGYGGGVSSSNFYKAGVYRTDADVPTVRTTDYLGSFGPDPVPGGAFASAAQLAASPCHAAVYLLASVYGGPNSTYSGNEVQEFDTHAAATLCAIPPIAAVAGFKKSYVLKKLGKKGSKPCTPCAELLRSGALARASDSQLAASSAARSKHSKKKKKRAGVKLRFRSAAAADVTFLFTRVGGKGHGRHKRKRLGGFIYAAHAGRNAFRFSGALHKGRPLHRGRYRVTASGGQGKQRFRLVIKRSR